jgi:adenosylhomocysteinase
VGREVHLRGERVRPHEARLHHAPAKKSGASEKPPAGHASSSKKSDESWVDGVASPRAKKVKAPGLEPWASYYPESKRAPKIAAGETIDTFDEAQARALHRAYWSAPPEASLPEMIKVAVKDPAFKHRKEAVDERQVGRLFAKIPESFPWGWRSRALAATSHLLVDALVKAPKGTPVTGIISQIEKEHPGFPGYTAFKKAAVSTWGEEPDRFPFAKELEKTKGGFLLQACGPTPEIHTDRLGRLSLNRALADKVTELSDDPSIRFDWGFEDFVAFLQTKLGEAFGEKTFQNLRDQFPDVPTYTEIRAKACRRLCELIRDLHASGLKEGKQLLLELHKKHGYPHWHTSQLTYFRNLHPDLVPDFKATKAEESYAEARALLDEIKKRPDESYIEVGATLGYNARRAHGLVSLIHKRWEDELPTQYKPPSYTLADKKILERAVEDAPLNAQIEDVLQILRTEAPEFLEVHPFVSAESFYASLRSVLEIDSWRELQQKRYAKVFADVASRSPPGTTLSELITTIQDEYPGAYGPSSVKRFVEKWKAHPKDFPEITKLKDSGGKFPWERSRINQTEALAKRVGQAIEANPKKTVRQIVNALMKDKHFATEYPTFSVNTVHHLRSKYPKRVPFVDDLEIHGNEERLAARDSALKTLAKKASKEADKVDDPSGLTIAYLARKLGVKPHRVLHAIRRSPALFPWYKERPAGEIDLYLATRVAHEMEQAPLGTSLYDIIDRLKSDEKFDARYPCFNLHSFARLRDSYPELVPHWYNRDQILRAKLLTDALLEAEKGTSFAKVAEELNEEHPGLFTGSWTRPYHLRDLYESDPKLFPFVKELGGKYAGHGKALEKSSESASELATRLGKLERITETLPLLDELAKGVHKEMFADFECLAIQHLLGPQVALFETMRKLGMAPSRSTVVGIPYSVSEPVAETLEDKGWDVRVPPLDLEAWYLEVKKAMEERIASSKKSGRPIIVMDDGGLAAMMFDKYPELAKEAHRFKIVEQTTRGITVADGVDLHSPLINVAQSWGKFVEGPMIGKVVAQKLIERLAGIDVKNLKGKHVGLVGYGTIGAPLAEFLREQGAIVTVRDLGKESRDRAEKAEFKVETDRKKFFSKQDIIIGATGKLSMTEEDFAVLKDGAILGSCSSKLVEIDVTGLKKASKKKGLEVIDERSFPPSVRYDLKDGRKIDLLASGFPLNFDGDVESVASLEIQLTMGLLLIGALQAANANAAGVRRLDPTQQLELLQAFDRVGGVEVSGAEVGEAMTKAVAMLKKMEKKHGAADRRHGEA